MTDAREVIALALSEGIRMEHSKESMAFAATNALSSAGFRILGPDEVDAVTVACEEALPYVSRYESENFSNVALDTVTKLSTAIRALNGGGAAPQEAERRNE